MERQVTELDDIECLRRCVAGDRSALRALTDLHGAAVNGTLYQILGDAALAEDGCVDVFAAVWRDARRFDASVSVRVWLYRHVVDAARRAPSSTNHDRGLMSTALAFLARSERSMLVLYYGVGLDVGEVAQVLRRPKFLVGRDLFGARRELFEVYRCLTGTGVGAA